MEILNDEYYRDMIRDLNEGQAIDFAMAAVKGAIDDTRKTNERVEKALDFMEARYLYR